MNESIWATVEADAWARSFTYEEYLEYKLKASPLSAPLSSLAYYLVYEALEFDCHDDEENG